MDDVDVVPGFSPHFPPGTTSPQAGTPPAFSPRFAGGPTPGPRYPGPQFPGEHYPGARFPGPDGGQEVMVPPGYPHQRPPYPGQTMPPGGKLYH